jgi:hypothetical protein
MVKVTLAEQPAPSEKPFPKTMISRIPGGGTVVIFAEKIVGGRLHGQVLHSTCKSNPVGKISDGWNTSTFTDYNEPITIQNA